MTVQKYGILLRLLLNMKHNSCINCFIQYRRNQYSFAKNYYTSSYDAR